MSKTFLKQLHIPDKATTGVYILAFIVTSYVNWFSTEKLNSITDISVAAIKTGVIFILMFGVVFVWNMLIIPSKINTEKDNQIEKLEAQFKKNKNLEKIYESLNIQHSKGQKIVNGDYGHINQTNTEPWVSETIKLMKDLNIDKSEIHQFEKPMFGLGIDHGMGTRMMTLHSYVTRYMNLSDA